MFQPPQYLASEQKTQHMFDALVQCSSKKTPKHYYPRKKVKEVPGLEFLCRTRMDYTQLQPGSVSGVAILPQWAESPNQTGAWALSPASRQDGYGGDTLPWWVPSLWCGDSHCWWHEVEEWYPESSRREVWCCTEGCRGILREIPQPQLSSSLSLFFVFRWLLPVSLGFFLLLWKPYS